MQSFVTAWLRQLSLLYSCFLSLFLFYCYYLCITFCVRFVNLRLLTEVNFAVSAKLGCQKRVKLCTICKRTSVASYC
jgi:hypothetical protein